ncbi:MAG TPA: hypothetical protein VFZ62_02025 [Candidatus Saccharimonadales bacterium]
MQDNDQGMIKVTTLAEPTATTLPRTPMSEKEAKEAAAAAELEHRQLVARGALLTLPENVRSGLDRASEEVQVLVNDGSWSKAATALDKSGQHSLASWLRLETPYALEC